MQLQKVLDDIAADVAPLVGTGKVASYIPALARIDPEQFGMAVHTTDGQSWATGNADTAFSIQSISKVFTLTLALQQHGRVLWQRVGREPSGDPFNSLVQLEHECGIPRNPLINAGAILIADALLDAGPKALHRLCSLVQQLTGQPACVDDEVAESERATGYRNAAMANLMKGFGNLHHSVDQVLELYFRQCSLAMNCAELARAFAFLANNGLHPNVSTPIVSPRRARRINALMLTCGTYDRAGEFAFEVGLPAKSGVGGGIVAIVPGQLCVCAWSPGLGDSGNSIAAVEALRLFVERTGLSVF